MNIPDCVRSVREAIRWMDIIHPTGRLVHAIVIDGALGERQEDAVRDMIRQEYGGPESAHASWLYLLRESVGPANARNTVIATRPPRDWMFFIDSDDYMYPWSIAARMNRVQQEVEKHKDESLDVFCYARVMTKYEQRPDYPMVSLELPPPPRVAAVMQSMNVLIPAMVCTRAGMIQRAGGFEPYLICGEDGNLFRRILNTHPALAYCDDPVAIYRNHDQGQSKLASSHPDTIAKFHPKAFHLDPEKHGPMGQALDEAARSRGALFKTLQEHTPPHCFDEFGTPSDWTEQAIEVLAPGTELTRVEFLS